MKRPEYDSLVAWYNAQHATPPPTRADTDAPSSRAPSRAPTQRPTPWPSNFPSTRPTAKVTATPSAIPSARPTPATVYGSDVDAEQQQQQQQEEEEEKASEEEAGPRRAESTDAIILASGAILIVVIGLVARHLCLRVHDKGNEMDVGLRAYAGVTGRRRARVMAQRSSSVSDLKAAVEMDPAPNVGAFLPVAAGPLGSDELRRKIERARLAQMLQQQRAWRRQQHGLVVM